VRSRQEFCLALKAARERNGTTLADISAATKIPASVLAALERGDLRAWPNGLYRRSFFRDYARAIGVPVAEACAEFVRLFPDGGGAAPAGPEAAEVDRTDEVRLVLDAAWHGPGSPVLWRVLAAAVDAVAVVLASVSIAWLSSADWAATLASVALAYFSAATMLFGESPATRALTGGAPAMAETWRHCAAAIAQAMGSADRTPSERVEDPERHVWITDARRVGPSRLRVRIKVPQ
jgi:hypothetical protein